MQFWEFIFIISCGIVFYNYGGYAILAASAINSFTRKIPIPPGSCNMPGEHRSP